MTKIIVLSLAFMIAAAASCGAAEGQPLVSGSADAVVLYSLDGGRVSYGSSLSVPVLSVRVPSLDGGESGMFILNADCLAVTDRDRSIITGGVSVKFRSSGPFPELKAGVAYVPDGQTKWAVYMSVPFGSF